MASFARFSLTTSPVAGHPLGHAFSSLATRHSPLATRHSPLATRHSPLATRHSPLATRHSPLATRHSPLATRHSPLATRHSPLATRHSPLATRHSPLATRHSPLATRHSPLATRHSPLATRHSPLATRHSPLATRATHEVGPAGSGQVPTLARWGLPTPTTEFPKSVGQPVAPSGPLSNDVIERGDSFTLFHGVFPRTDGPTIDHFLVASGAQCQRLETCPVNG